MLKVDKKIEYALMVLKHMKMDKVTKAKEISSQYGLPLPMLAKVMYKLASGGFLDSKKGVDGGFTINKGDFNLLNLVELMSGPVECVKCQRTGFECVHSNSCTISNSMKRLNDRLVDFCKNIKIEELTN